MHNNHFYKMQNFDAYNRSFEQKLTASQAVLLQKELAGKVIIENSNLKIKKIAGADVSYSARTNTMYAGFIVMHYPELTVIDWAACKEEAVFPYIPGLLSFREGKALCDAFLKLRIKPDLIIFDGQGIAHPRRFGIASHIGLILGIPSIGSAKSKLTGESKIPGKKKGDYELMYHKGITVGAALCAKNGTKPIYVSPGYKTEIEESINLIIDLCRQFKLPEPIRQAHNFVNNERVKNEKVEYV